MILIPDNDAPGRKRVLNIARALVGKVARLVVLELEGGVKGRHRVVWPGTF